RRLGGRGLQGVPAPLGRGAEALARRLPGRWRLAYGDAKAAKLGRVLAAGSLAQAYLALLSDWPAPGPPLAGPREELGLAWPGLGTVCEDLLLLDLVGYLPDDILVKLDRASMACSLEARVPYLAPEVVEVAWRLPLDCRVRAGRTKWVLRQVLARYLPPQLTDRPKMGFGVPVGDWLRGELRPWAEELLSARRLRCGGLVDPQPVRRAWDQHLSGRRDWSHQLWDVLVLQAWLERWAPRG
ncbi:MAG TPA: asparagine synthase C-terminal domain-containing protein, partial [Acidimicrobiales bacterium]|nr:asparagine synthase C-terminal domain-containing protein [Acidimicrobiales bacterium]